MVWFCFRICSLQGPISAAFGASRHHRDASFHAQGPVRASKYSCGGRHVSDEHDPSAVDTDAGRQDRLDFSSGTTVMIITRLSCSVNMKGLTNAVMPLAGDVDDDR